MKITKTNKGAFFFSLLLPILLMVFNSMTKVAVPSDKETVTTETAAKTEEINYLTVDKLPLNRKGRNVKVKPGLKLKYGKAHTGFLFDKGDNNTEKWRPQGVTGTSVGGKKFIIVSWYGIKDAGYNDRGARISVVNVTDMDNIDYRHILLVDKDKNTFPGCHAGGIALIGNKLHVADSRGSKNKPYTGPDSPNGSYDQVLVFDITKIEKVDTAIKKYEYILRMESSYNLPVNPSYITYDRDDKKMLTGTFTCKEVGFCNRSGDFSTGLAKLCFYDPATVNRNTPYSELFKPHEDTTTNEFRQHQGAGTVTYKGEKYLVTSASYGIEQSKLSIFKKVNGEWELVLSREILAQGLEDIYFSQKNMWTLSEFRPGEMLNAFNNRAVVAIKISELLKQRIDY